jgi:tellurite resistance protein TehA-like permease
MIVSAFKESSNILRSNSHTPMKTSDFIPIYALEMVITFISGVMSSAISNHLIRDLHYEPWIASIVAAMFFFGFFLIFAFQSSLVFWRWGAGTYGVPATHRGTMLLAPGLLRQFRDAGPTAFLWHRLRSMIVRPLALICGGKPEAVEEFRVNRVPEP